MDWRRLTPPRIARSAVRRLRARLDGPVGARLREFRASFDPWVEQPSERQLRLRNRISRARVTGAGPAVSLTTHGPRIATVHVAIESIARGALRPHTLTLWIDDPALLTDLPPGLRRLQRRGLSIERADPYGPHTKYYPYLLRHPEASAPLVTADDDIVYPRSWLAGLDRALRADPSSVHCYRAHRIRIIRGRIAPYLAWLPCVDTNPSPLNFATGVSGVIYPPEVLRAIADGGAAFVERCPVADDVWLHHRTLAAGFPVRQITSQQQHFPMVEGTQGSTLMASNTYAGGNDTQIRKTYTPEDVQALVDADRAATAPHAD